MKYLILFALKNLARYKRRTIITASAVAVGIAVFIVVDSLLLGAEKESDRNLVWYETSYARVMHPGYWEERERLPLSYVIENPSSLEKSLLERSIPYAPRTVFSAELIVRQDPFEEDGALNVRAFAIDPQKDDNVFRFKDTVIEGRYLTPGEEGVILGSWLAEDLGAKVGFPVTLVTRTRDGFFQTMELEIVGIVNCPNPVINRASVFIPLDIADLYLQMEGAVTEINLRFPETANVNKMASFIEEYLDNAGFKFEVMSWKEIASSYGALTKSKRTGSGVILFLIFIIAAVGISNTMLMAVYERTRELGMLRAVGMKDWEIRFLFMAEAAGIGLLGGVIGITLGALGNIFLVNVGIDYSWMVRDMDIGYRTAGVMRGAWNPGTMVRAFIIGTFICAMIAYIPTRRALKMKITECLRHS